MSVTPKMTLIGMYCFDGTLFDSMTLPASVDLETFRDCLLLEKGELPVLYQSIDFNKQAFGLWSKKWYHSIERIALTMKEDYNPLHNFDRHEEYTDSEDVTREGQTGENVKTEGESTRRLDASGTDGTENTVSAYNSDTYQPDNKSERTFGNGEDETTNIQNQARTDTTRNDTERRSFAHTGHLYGNIGVTRSQEMLLDELHLRSAHNVYDVLVAMFANEFLIPVY